MKSLSLLLLVLLNSGHIIELFAEPRVEIHQGFLRGTTSRSRRGRNFSSFIGVPYAQPPVGKLRFRSPEPAEPWKGVYLANKEANICPQEEKGKIIGNEDCLYLNVFTPQLEFDPSMIDNTLLPVMVWIHGGGYVVGNGGFFGPNYLLDKDIVLVTMNYRLGILGFLTTGDSVAPGNFGLKDQVLALKWVQKNIQFFGGDPNRVTIFGNSAGGSSVHLHVLSNASNGLFHQYIYQSGNAICPFVYQDRTEHKFQMLEYAEKLGCPSTDSSSFVNCLRDLTVEELVNVAPGSILDFPSFPWKVTNEIDTEGAFLTDSPVNLIREGKMKDLPFMNGVEIDEGLPVTFPFYRKSTFEPMEYFLEKSIVSSSYFYSPGDLMKYRKRVKGYYFNKPVNRIELLQNYTTFEGDSGFTFPHVAQMDRMVKIAKTPFYFYSFGYLGNMYLTLGVPQDYGVPHGIDALFLFPITPQKYISKTDSMVIDLMVDLWTSFAINGKPTSDVMNVPNLWRPYNKGRYYLQIGNINDSTDPSVTLEEKYRVGRMNFWRNNFPIL